MQPPARQPTTQRHVQIRMAGCEPISRLLWSFTVQCRYGPPQSGKAD